MAGKQLVAAVDQGTSSSRVVVYEAGSGEVVAQHQQEVQQLTPQEGWVEQDPEELLSSVEACLAGVAAQLDSNARLAGLGITNQRETVVVWDRKTGRPLYPAIVWCDARNGTEVASMVAKHGKDVLRDACGLPLATYFSATKLRWLLDNVPVVAAALEADTLMAGTVDSWLIWNLTGGLEGGLHLTDVTNASRTMLMNLCTLDWDSALLHFFSLPRSALPAIQPSSSHFGNLTAGTGPFAGTPITGVIGDQQAALLGHGCVRRGEAKCTFGTGCFMLAHTGEERVQSSSGLLTTVAYQQQGGEPQYALEGSVAVAGLALRWLRDNLGLIKDYEEAFQLAAQVERTDGVYFVPAFSGLFAPRWRADARGTLCGLTAHTTKQHIARAVIESVCFQVTHPLSRDTCHWCVGVRDSGGDDSRQRAGRGAAAVRRRPHPRPGPAPAPG